MVHQPDSAEKHQFEFSYDTASEGGRRKSKRQRRLTIHQRQGGPRAQTGYPLGTETRARAIHGSAASTARRRRTSPYRIPLSAIGPASLGPATRTATAPPDGRLSPRTAM